MHIELNIYIEIHLKPSLSMNYSYRMLNEMDHLSVMKLFLLCDFANVNVLFNKFTKIF